GSTATRPPFTMPARSVSSSGRSFFASSAAPCGSRPDQAPPRGARCGPPAKGGRTALSSSLPGMPSSRAWRNASPNVRRPEMALAVVGSINCDVIAYVERLPRPGETLAASAYRLGLGGKGANQAVAARRLGSAVSLIGRVGGDAFGRTVLDALRRFAVDTALVAVDRDGATGMAMIHVAADGENTIAIVAGGNGGVGNAELEQGNAALG